MTRQRLQVIDLLRGFALVAMASFHFSWDLSWFRLVDWPVGSPDSGWRTYAICIAGSFLFLSGFSLVLAHGRERARHRWRSFWKREIIIALAAALVSLATWLAMGDEYVRFGILHCMATVTLVAVPFFVLPFHLPPPVHQDEMQHPAWGLSALITALAGCFSLSLPFWASSHVFDGLFWLWTGLGEPGVGSVDYVPLFPWVGFTLLGVAAAQGALKIDLLARLAPWRFDFALWRGLRALGRHSLAFYLLHQPILYGLVWLVVASGLTPDPVAREFVTNCTNTCSTSSSSPHTCKAVCTCTLNDMQERGKWKALVKSPEDEELRQMLNNAYATCGQSSGGAAPSR